MSNSEASPRPLEGPRIVYRLLISGIVVDRADSPEGGRILLQTFENMAAATPTASFEAKAR